MCHLLSEVSQRQPLNLQPQEQEQQQQLPQQQQPNKVSSTRYFRERNYIENCFATKWHSRYNIAALKIVTMQFMLYVSLKQYLWL